MKSTIVTELLFEHQFGTSKFNNFWHG